MYASVATLVQMSVVSATEVALLRTCDELVSEGPAYGYFVNASKTWLVTKENHKLTGASIFHNIRINITKKENIS